MYKFKISASFAIIIFGVYFALRSSDPADITISLEESSAVEGVSVTGSPAAETANRVEPSRSLSTPRTASIDEALKNSPALSTEHSPIDRDSGGLYSTERVDNWSSLTDDQKAEFQRDRQRRTEAYRELVYKDYNDYFESAGINQETKENILLELIAVEEIRQDIYHRQLIGEISQSEMANELSKSTSGRIVGNYLDNDELLEFLTWELNEIL